MAAQEDQNETLEAKIARVEAEKEQARADVEGFRKQSLALTLTIAMIEKERDPMK
jgi:uncharacterized protein YdcH (DUF465 family)